MAFLDRSKFPGLAATVYAAAFVLCFFADVSGESEFHRLFALVVLTFPWSVIFSLFGGGTEVWAEEWLPTLLCGAVNAFVVYRVAANIAGRS